VVKTTVGTSRDIRLPQSSPDVTPFSRARAAASEKEIFASLTNVLTARKQRLLRGVRGAKATDARRHGKNDAEQ